VLFICLFKNQPPAKLATHTTPTAHGKTPEYIPRLFRSSDVIAYTYDYRISLGQRTKSPSSLFELRSAREEANISYICPSTPRVACRSGHSPRKLNQNHPTFHIGCFSTSEPMTYGRVECPREESNLDYKIRNLASYPLNDEGVSSLRSILYQRRIFKLKPQQTLQGIDQGPLRFDFP
jgi:hypothetical protein